MKIKFDPKSIQDFFLNHGEKILFGLVVLAFLWFAQYAFLHRKGLSQPPADLMRIATETFERIKRPPEKLSVEVKDYEDIIKKTIGHIDPKAYSHQVLWCPPILDPLPKRGEPRLLTARQLRASAGYAKVYVNPATTTARAVSPEEMPMTEGAPPIASMPSMGRENVEGERWVVLTGLVPYKEQIEAYREAFRTAAREFAMTTGLQTSPAGGFRGVPAAGEGALLEGGPMPGAVPGVAAPTGASPDIPIYVHYHVQRVEVQGPSDTIAEADWEAGWIYWDITDKQKAAQRWASGLTSAISQQPDMGIDPRFWDPALDFPLPRFADGRQLDESFAHPPEIPLLQKKMYQMGPDGRPMPVGATPAETSQEKVEPEKVEPVSPSPTPKPKPPGRNELGIPEGPEMGLPGRGEFGAPGAVPGVLPPGMEGMGAMGPMPGGAPGSLYPTMRLPEFKLFRFLDRTVQPGKRYRYRVRLVLVNPNYNQNPQLLERVELGKQKYIVTPWSEPSNVVEVPRDDRLLVLGVKPALGHQAETTAKVVLLKWLPKEGEIAYKEQERVFRGQLLNLPNQKWPEEQSSKSPPSSKTTSKSSAKPSTGPAPGLEDYQMLLEAPKKKTTKEKEKEKEKGKTPLTPEGMGPMGPQPKAPMDIDYMTECLVVDVRGGYRIDLRGQGRPPHSDPSYNAPGEILLLDPEGSLYVQNELDDTQEYEKIHELNAPKYEQFGPGWMGMPPGMLEGAMPPPAGVPGELAPGQTGRPKSKTPARGEQPPRTPKPTPPPRG